MHVTVPKSDQKGGDFHFGPDYKSKMAVFKSFVITIFINHPGQCYLIRNQEDGGI